jgi:Tfp pilus assembly protein PilP
MPNIEVNSQVYLSDLLNGVGQLNTNDLEQFVFQVLALRAKRIAPNVSNQEAEMLEKINQSLPFETQQRYNVLVTKRQSETLTPEEYQELLSLIDCIELADTERVQTLTKLAQLRNVSVTALMTKLNIRPPVYG